MVHYYMTFEKLNERKRAVIDMTNEMKCITLELKNFGKKQAELVRTRENQLKALESTDDEIRKLKFRNLNLQQALKDLSSKIDEQKNVILNTELIEEIVVDRKGEYLLPNGLVDLNRDVVMKIIRILESEEKIRNVIGIANIFFKWSKTPIFQWAVKPLYSTYRPIKLLNSVSRNAHVVLNHDPFSVVWRDYGGFCGVLAEELNERIYKLKLRCSGEELDHSLEFGLVSRSFIADNFSPLRFDTFKHSENGFTIDPRYERGLVLQPGACCLAHYYVCVGKKSTDYGGDFFPPSGSFSAGLEVNTQTHTLYFFVEGRQVAHCITRIPPFVRFAFSNYMENVIVEIESFQKITSATNSTTMLCIEHPWV